MDSRIVKTLCLLALTMGPAIAGAQTMLEKGVYFEIGVGKSEFKDVSQAGLDAFTDSFFEDFELPMQSLTSTLSTKDRSYTLLSGYRFNEFLSVEAGFFRLGAFQYQGNGTVNDEGTIRPASLRFTYRAKGFLIGGTAAWPVGEFLDLRARAGFSNTDTRVRLTAALDGEPLEDSYSESAQDIYYGAGVGFKVFEYYRLGLDWMRHPKAGKSGNGSVDVDNLLLSFSYEY